MAGERYSSKRYGVRYGRRLRDKIGEIELGRRSDNCPYCHYKKIERIASGIWFCRKCESKFTGRAYRVGKKVEGELLEEKEVIAETAEKPEVQNG